MPDHSTLDLLDDLPRARETIEIAPGALWLKGWLPLDEQRSLVARCHEIMDGHGGGYVPTVRGGGKMHVRMTCLGRHWNPLTYQYVSTRADHDDAPVAPVPEDEKVYLPGSAFSLATNSRALAAAKPG